MDKSDWRVLYDEEWYRVYTSPRYPRIYESKFATGEASVSLVDLQSRWLGWDEGEHVQFAQAFARKPELTPEDEGVLDFLMCQDGEEVSSSIALLVAKLSDKRRAVDFLTASLGAFPKSRGNFLCALATLAAPETIPHLLLVYQECSGKIRENANDLESVADLLFCSAALSKTTKEPKYTDLISSYFRHSDGRIRDQAANAIRWAWPGK